MKKTFLNSRMEEHIIVGPHSLSEKGIPLLFNDEETELPQQPPPTPEELVSDCFVTILPIIPDDIQNMKIPYIREVGIREAIQQVAPYFNSEGYAENLTQFWLLDVIVDVIWRCQDEYRFTIAQQKCILEWFLFVLKLVARSKMTKELLFKIFNEAMIVADDYVMGGGEDQPSPKKLFTIDLDKNEDEMLSLTSSNISGSVLTTFEDSLLSSKPFELSHSPGQLIVIKGSQECQVFKIAANPTECLLSSVDSLSESNMNVCELSQMDPYDKISSEESEKDIQFIRTDDSTPPRFKSLPKIENEQSESIEKVPGIKSDSSSEVLIASGIWKNISRNPVKPKCPDKLFKKKTVVQIEERKSKTKSIGSNVEQSTDLTAKIDDKINKGRLSMRTSNQPSVTPPASQETPSPPPLRPDQILRAFYEYHIWELKKSYMADSRKGWTSLNESQVDLESSKKKKSFSIPPSDSNDIFLKRCLLMAVRQIIFDYFDHGFAFELVKIAFMNPQYYIAQDINKDWNIPKVIKGDIKKPIPKRPKLEKVKKEKKPKRDKSKSSKKTKSSKRSKKDKSSKSTKSKKSKDDKKSKDTKSKKPDKQSDKDQEEIMQKEELERVLLEAQNKMYMFPLRDAVDEQFFMEIFPQLRDGNGAKGGRETDDLTDKTGKSSESSKGSKKKKKGKSKV